MMSCVWEEEKRLGSHRLRRSTLESLGGAAKIFTRHLDQAMAALGEPERQIAARLFDYMVTPSGSKIAHTTRDLVSRAGAEPQQVTKTLEKLAAQRIVRGLDHPDGYEIFHDVLGPAILDWVKRYEKRRHDRAHRRLLLLAGILLVYFISTATGLIVNWVRARKAQEGQRLSVSRELALRSIGNAESGDPELAVLLALQGLRIAATPEGDTALNRALASSRVRATLSGHTGAINRIAVSPDGTRIATASADQTVRVWDSFGKPLRTLTGHRGAVTDVAFNGDGTTIASASEDGFIGIWEAESGRNLRMLQNDGPATALAYSGRSKVLAVGGDNGLVRVWDIEAGRALATWRGHTSRVRSLSFSPDEQLAASGSSDGTILLWDARSGKLLKSARDTDQVWSVAFSRDGQSVLTSGADGLLKLLPVQKNLEARRLGKQPEVGLDLVSSAVYDGSGTRIAYGGWDHAARVVNAGTGQETMVLRGHRGPVLSVVFAPREQRLYTASQDSEAKIWDVSPNAETQRAC